MKTKSVHTYIQEMFSALCEVGNIVGTRYELHMRKRYSPIVHSVTTDYRLCRVIDLEGTDRIKGRDWFKGWSASECLENIMQELDKVEKVRKEINKNNGELKDTDDIAKII